MLAARLANHRNPHIAILSLALLDTLVKSCGYPFHLQISTKEFLNELVRRFPERPPPFPGPVMSRILELIHSWKEGICAESRWREDLGNIRDMHRLLQFKGYRFRDASASRQNQSLEAVAVSLPQNFGRIKLIVSFSWEEFEVGGRARRGRPGSAISEVARTDTTWHAARFGCSAGTHEIAGWSKPRRETRLSYTGVDGSQQVRTKGHLVERDAGQCRHGERREVYVWRCLRCEL